MFPTKPEQWAERTDGFFPVPSVYSLWLKEKLWLDLPHAWKEEGRNQSGLPLTVGEVSDAVCDITRGLFPELCLYLAIYCNCGPISSSQHWAAVLTETPGLRSAPEAGRQALPDHRAHQHEARVAGKDGRGAERRLSANLLPAGWGWQLAAGYDWRSAAQPGEV